MVAPKMQWQFSIGNITQIAVFLVTLAVGWTTMSAQIKTNTQAISEGKAARSEMEMRLRAMENSNARADERLSNIFTLLSRIDARLERIEQTEKTP